MPLGLGCYNAFFHNAQFLWEKRWNVLHTQFSGNVWPIYEAEYLAML
jgi:hypothetical protein